MIPNDTTLPELSPEDSLWLSKLPPHLQNVARRHGRGLFELTLNCASATADLSAMSKLIRARDAQARLFRVSRALAHIAEAALTGGGWTREAHQECKEDLDRAIDLGAGQAAGSRIVLPH